MADQFAQAPITLSGDSDLEVGEDLSGSSTQSGEGSLAIDVPSLLPTLSANSSFVIQGLQVTKTITGVHHVQKYVGELNIPQDIKRLRRQSFEMMRRMGTPVVVKAMLTDRDRLLGTAEDSPNFDPVYKQVRARDPLSHGTGFVSIEKDDAEWIDAAGDVVLEDTGTPAPKYRGFGPGYLTYIIEPDAADDYYTHTETGVFIKVQTATAQAPWWPDINDNDLLIHVTLDEQGNIVATNERYQAKITNPVSIRGLDRRGRKEYSGDFGNRHVINQTFEMTLIPIQHEFYQVEIDR